MPEIPRPERITQNRVIGLFINKSNSGCLGYRYLGEWSKRENNRAIETAILRDNMTPTSYCAMASRYNSPSARRLKRYT